jgi:hypothetical protein
MTTSSVFTKDPDAILDYKFDFAPLTHSVSGATSDYLANGETISSCVVVASSGLTVASYAATDTNTSVTAWLSGGTVDTDYNVACKIVTSQSRTDERTIIVRVRQR